MKKWIIITNVAWFLMASFLAFFAKIQSDFAEEHRLRAEKNAAEARLQEDKAIEQATLARQAQHVAENARREAEIALQECENQK